jgi:crotonobetainyl-CoA:carnitine CoA-transferase CaiB-like acyl-CoA transferase
MFAWANVGKRSVVLDLKSPEGRRALEALIASADILLDALRPGAMAALGLDDDRVRELNPGIVHATVLPYGEEGPLRDLPGFEPLMQAHGGIMSYTGTADGPPVRSGTSIVDLGTAMWTAMGVLAAILERGDSGRGARLSGSLFDTALAWSGYHLLAAAAGGQVAQRWGSELPMIVPYGTFPTKGGPVMIAAGTEGLFRKLARVLQLEELLADERFRENAGRVAHRHEVNEAVAGATRLLGEEELLALLRAQGVPAAPVRDVGELLDDPQFEASGMLTREEGGVSQPLPLRFEGARLPAPAEPPALGADTEEVLDGLELPESVRAALRGASRSPVVPGE